MSRRTPRRAAVLVLISSLGILAVLPARAAQTRSELVIQPDVFVRTLVYNVIDFLRSLAATKDNPPPNGPPNPGSYEGSSGCPLGGKPPCGPPN
jgi:hypothetical protein